MQQCTFCGAYLAERSLACSRCGRDQLPSAPFIPSEKTPDRHTPTGQEHGPTRPTQGTQQLSHQFQQYYHPQFSPQEPQPTQKHTEQAVSLQQHKGQGASNAHRGKKNTFPKWIMAVIAVLVIASGIGVFALTSHNSFSASEASRTTSHSTPNSNVTQSLHTGNSPTTTSTHAPTPTPPKSTSSIPTCSSSTSGSHTGTFTFTGEIAGTISLSTFEACNSAAISCYVPCWYASKNGDRTYLGKAQGKINGATYQFEFFINPYSGPGTYTATENVNVVLLRNNYEWENYGTTSSHASIVVGSNEKIGSLHATISMMSPQFDPTSVVIVTGNWS